MRGTSRRLTLAIAGFASVLGCGSALAAYVFNSIDFPGAQQVQTFGINNAGQIAVSTDIGAFVYQDGAFIDLPAPPPGLAIGPIGLNDAGEVVGSAADGAGNELGFLLSGGTYRSFAHPGWPFRSSAATRRAPAT